MKGVFAGLPCLIASTSNARSSNSRRRARKSKRFPRSRRAPKAVKIHKNHKNPPRYVSKANIFPVLYKSPPSPSILVESSIALIPTRRLQFNGFAPPIAAPSPAPSSPPVGSSSPHPSLSMPVGSGSHTSVGLLAGIIVGLASVVVVTVIAGLLWWRRKKRSHAPSGMVSGDNPGQLEANSNDDLFHEASDNLSVINVTEVQLPSSRLGPHNFSCQHLSVATKNFSSSELLGRGGFGPVYRGTLPNDGSLVAVKCISDDSSQGIKEFKAEVTIISNLRHRNLVKLRGWCHENGKLFLVYDYLPNGSLRDLLFDNEKCVALSWSRRFSIVLGLGSALQYLHEEFDSVIIHRDIKSSNVLLDGNFLAKLGDFGLSRQMDQGVFAHTTVVAGTRGYIAPEVFGTGKATMESDVYSFGIVLAEVSCGKSPLDASLTELVDWVWDLHGKGRLLEAADGRLKGLFDAEQMRRVLIVALACSHPDPTARPSIRRALEALHGTTTLPFIPPSKPTLNYAPLPPMSIPQALGDSTMFITATSSTLYWSTPFSISSDQHIH